MPERFGARLRQRREAQNVALSTIADQTKIKLSLLEALERDDVSHWPSGIFRRAYIRTYAESIGLSPDDTLREFLEVHPDPDSEAAAAAAMLPSVDRSSQTGAPPSRLRSMMSSALDSLSRRLQAPLVINSLVTDPNPVAPQALEPGPHEAIAPVLDQPQQIAVGRLPIPDAVPTIGSTLAPSTGTLPDFDPPAPPLPEEIVADEPTGAGSADVPRPSSEPTLDLGAFALVCTQLGRVASTDAMLPLLEEAARILDASGIILWIWDSTREELRPALAYGYSRRVLAHLPAVSPGADNATAHAFRLVESRVIEGDADNAGALVVPMQTPAGCAGVLAFELKNGSEQSPPVHALATILAAFLAQIVGAADAGASAATDVMAPAV